MLVEASVNMVLLLATGRWISIITSLWATDHTCDSRSTEMKPGRYEPEFFIKVVQGQGIVSWAAVDTNRSNVNREELVGFVTARAVTAPESEVRNFALVFVICGGRYWLY